jgi:hypothetical protein
LDIIFLKNLLKLLIIKFFSNLIFLVNMLFLNYYNFPKLGLNSLKISRFVINIKVLVLLKLNIEIRRMF